MKYYICYPILSFSIKFSKKIHREDYLVEIRDILTTVLSKYGLNKKVESMYFNLLVDCY